MKPVPTGDATANNDYVCARGDLSIPVMIPQGRSTTVLIVRYGSLLRGHIPTPASGRWLTRKAAESGTW